MQGIEHSARSLPRIFRMSVVTRNTRKGRPSRILREPIPQTLWGAVDGGPEETLILYVFSGPGRMAGTSLLLRDAVGGTQRDANWFYLRTLERFERLQGAVERSTMPNTALTYEDARGYIASDRYYFSFSVRDGGANQVTRHVRACPRSAGIAEKLGYGALDIEVDSAFQHVRSITYQGLGGGLLKTLHVLEVESLEQRRFPKRVVIEDPVEESRNEIQYEYWSPVEKLASKLFSPEVAGGKGAGSDAGAVVAPLVTPLMRMQRLLRDNGLGDRVDREIEMSAATE
jgi:hypothetical protein